MIIAPHHIKGTVENAISTKLCTAVEYTPVCAWPDDCYVQWGNGIIPANPFFEAFPKGTFIRGDGKTIEEAERKAFAQFQSEFGCDHQFGRHRKGHSKPYLNGAGFCRKCGAFRSDMFQPVVKLGHMREPISKWMDDALESYEKNEDGLNEYIADRDPKRDPERRRMYRQFRLRKNLFGVSDKHF